MIGVVLVLIVEVLVHQLDHLVILLAALLHIVVVPPVFDDLVVEVLVGDELVVVGSFYYLNFKRYVQKGCF